MNGLYTIRIIAIGENNNDTAFANVDVIHKSVETKVYVIENETQSLTAGDSIKPIVFKVEHGSNPELTNFPGGYVLKKDGNTGTITGLVEENAKGPYEVVLTVTGADNNASAKATINVAAGVMSFDVIEGSDNQTVVAGQKIVPIVYQYNHVKDIHGKLPANLKMEPDKEKKQVKISGIVDSKSGAHEYAYSFDLTDYYGETKTVTGKINVVRELSSSSVAASSSSEATSSSSAKSSSSSAKSSSSNVILSSSEGSSNSSVVQSSSSSAKQSSSSNVILSSSEGSSSSSVKQSSSSEKTIKIVTVAMNSVKFGYANNALTVAEPTSSMVRVQVFDLTGHLVETFAEPVNGTKSISLAHLNRGNYLVRVESNSMVRTARIAVK